MANHRNNNEVLEIDSEDYEENEGKDWEEDFFQLRKTQEQLEDHTVEINEMIRKNKKHVKEKEEEKHGNRKIIVN